MRHFQLQSGSMSSQKAACRPRAVITVGTANQGRQLRVQARRQAPIVEEEVQQASEQQNQEATGFSAVVQKLLHRAASSLTRGQTTCLACKGQGTCTCPACNVSQAVVLRSRHDMCSALSGLTGQHSVYCISDGRVLHCAWPACLVAFVPRHVVCVLQGTGIVDKDTRQNVMRHTAQKVRSMLQVERSEYHSNWLTSNRSVGQQLPCNST